ncbi:hypothetical protein BDL97_17G056300 [Sphagnum fallax]|nr:hypothetical protein BDL97_17G056300 [Sphagnum fallax]
MYTVLFPLILMVSALSAERAACRHHIGMAGKCHRQSGSKLSQWLLVFPTSEGYRGDASVGSSLKEMMSVPASKSEVVLKERCELQPEGELETLLLNRKLEYQNEYCSLCNWLIRKGLFVGCLAITFLHWRLLSSLTRGYGSTVLVMTPIFAWTVPALIVFSLIQTSPIRPISVAAHEK